MNAPPSPHPAERYLRLSQDLTPEQLAGEEVNAAVAALSPLDEPLLRQLIARADELARRRPAAGWALLTVATAAAARDGDTVLEGVAAWHLARMANLWTRPRRVEAAVARARARFEALEDPAWIAACQWQLNAQAWTRNDFPAAEAALLEALKGMRQPVTAPLQAWPLDVWEPHLRADLAYAHLLTRRYDEALEQIRRAEDAFRRREDELALGRALVTKGEVLLRHQEFDAALKTVQETIAIFKEHEATVDLARARYRLGNVHILAGRDLHIAEEVTEAALSAFADADIPLWTALCLNRLADLARDRGHMLASFEHLDQARRIYGRFSVLGARADNLLDTGITARNLGRLEDARRYFEEAKALYSEIKHPFMPALAQMYLGDASVRLGRYQGGIGQLEEACRQLQQVGGRSRAQECGLHLASAWLQLGHAQPAFKKLEEIGGHYQEIGQKARFAEYLTLRAEALFQMDQVEEAMSLLEKALAGSPLDTFPTLKAELHFHLGKLLSGTGRNEEALAHLERTREMYHAMDLSIEKAECQVAVGHAWLGIGDAIQARAAWEGALRLSLPLLPDIAWRAHAGLAELARREKKYGDALNHFSHAVEGLTRVRRWFWQSALGNHFLQQQGPVRPLALLQAAVRTAARHGTPEETMHFVEAAKAQTLNRQLLRLEKRFAARSGQDDKLTALEEEIRFLDQEIRTSTRSNPGFLRPPAEIEMRRRLAECVSAYDERLAELERRHHTGGDSGTDGAEFPGMDVEGLRALAARVIPDRKWVALDFHLADHELTMVLVTPEEVQVVTRRVTPFLARLIDRPQQIHHATGPDPARSYKMLGRLLLQEIEALVEPDTFLFIAPHGPLHDLPWAALHLPESGRPLAAAAIPVVVPTLSTLALLWQRENIEEAGKEVRNAGLLLAISDFDGRRQRLDAVIVEAERLENVPDLSVDSLREEQATWEALLARAGNHGLARYRFWHVASHAFHDQYSGRLSGVALYDRDIWLDDLWRFAPLPPLVVISACSAGKYGLFAGDEPIGLVTTALAAGARQVVASQRPIPDAEAAALTGHFYDAFVQGKSAPEALALAQRAAFVENMPASIWGHYLCVGTP